MKIMFVTNNKEYKYNEYTKSGWNLLPSLFTKKGAIVLGIGKYELFKFPFKYLKFKPDLIVVEWVPASLIPIFFKKIGFVKCPLILNWGDYYAEMMTRYPHFLIKLMEEYTVKNVNYVTTVSRRNEKIAKRLGKKVYYIPHGYFKSTQKTKINLNKLKINKTGVKVVYLGEQTKWKKVDQIIKAVNDLNCDLFLLGTPNPEFQQTAGKNVHFLGYISELEVGGILQQADILVNTSNQDCNFKFFEYLHIRKPILAYDGLPANILKHKETALLTKNFKEGLAELIKDKKLRQKIQKNLTKVESYSWDEIAEKHLNFYREVVSKTKHLGKSDSSII